MLHVQPTINLSESLVHGWAALLAELTMKDDDCVHQIFNLLLIFKEKVFHLLRLIDV